jgi:hypothetical protein
VVIKSEMFIVLKILTTLVMPFSVSLCLRGGMHF